MKFPLAMVLAFTAGVSAEFTGEATVMGTPVPRTYIARATGAACNTLSSSIDLMKLSIEGASVRNREPAPQAYRVATSCYLTFMGGETLKTAVEKMDGVEAVEADQYVATLAPKSWGLDRVDQASLPLDNKELQTAYTGAGVNIYVIDTGINKDHVDFGGRASFGGDFVNEGAAPDRNGHGTHCSGTAAGGSYGIARGARVIGVKVLSGSGSGTNSGVIGGIEWAVNDAGAKSAVLSMSLGGGKSSVVENAVKDAVAAGHIVVVAAGNENQNACNVSPAGAGGNAVNGGVITVGSTTETDGRSSFSNYGSCVDIFAPGSSITSAWYTSSTATNTISGTSMATPHVAGIAALYLQKNGGNKVQAQADLMASVASNKISGVNGSPNKLAQVPLGGNPTPTSPPVTTPVTNPTPRPTPQPTPQPTPKAGTWTCPNSWFGADDGCDCECGGGDPDCYVDYTKLYCNGNSAEYYEVCNLITDRCVPYWTLSKADAEAAGRTTDPYPSKERPAELVAEESSSVAVPIAASLAGVAAFVAVGAVVARRRRNQGAQMSSTVGGSVVSPSSIPQDQKIDL